MITILTETPSEFSMELCLETGIRPDKVKPDYKYIIQLSLIVNCDENSLTYVVTNLYTEEQWTFDNYRQALKYFDSLVEE
jgi:hypothetical protein